MVAGEIQYSNDDWPVFRMTVPHEPLAHAAIVRNFAVIDELFVRRQPFAMLVDVTRAAPPTAVQRQEIAEHMKRNAARYPDLLKGIALVMSSPLHRGVLTAMLWLVRPPYAMAPFESEVKAFRWLQNQLALPISAAGP